MSRYKLAYRPVCGGVGIVPSTTRRWATLGCLAVGQGRTWLVTAEHAVGAVNLGATLTIHQGPWGQPFQDIAQALEHELLRDPVLDLIAVPLSAGVTVVPEILGLGVWSGVRTPAVGDVVVKVGVGSGLVRGIVRAVGPDRFRVGLLPTYPVEYSLGETGDSGAAWLTWPALAVAGIHTGTNTLGEALVSSAPVALGRWGLTVL